jgi:hypothetical protein
MDDIVEIIQKNGKSTIPSDDKDFVVNGFNKDLLKLIQSISELSNKIIDRPSVDEKVINLSYYLEKKDIKNLYELVQQKISPSDPKDLTFNIRVQFSDKNSRRFSSLEQFMDDNETRPISAVSVRLRWQMTKYFKNVVGNPLLEKQGEKQFVEVLFTIPPENSARDSESIFIFDDQVIEGFGIIRIAVGCSDKMWCKELFGHIEDFAETIRISGTGAKEFIFRNREKLGKVVEKTMDLSSIIPMGMLAYLSFFSSKNMTNILSLKLLSLSFLLFLINYVFSFYVGRAFYYSLKDLKPIAVISITDFTINKLKNKKPKIVLGSKLVTLGIIPIAINIISTIICIALKIN